MGKVWNHGSICGKNAGTRTGRREEVVGWVLGDVEEDEWRRIEGKWREKGRRWNGR